MSYEMPNGSGEATGGGFNYWDLSYNGSGSPNVDGAPLSGGTGDLTDGIFAILNWYDVENLDGTGPWVGWSDKLTPNPVLTFRFAGPISLASLTLHLDDTDGYGAVAPPISVDIGLEGGPFVNYLITDPVGGTPVSFTFSGLGLTGPAVTLRFHHSLEWIFLSEVTFDGAYETPEPSTLSMVLAAAIAVHVRRRS